MRDFSAPPRKATGMLGRSSDYSLRTAVLRDGNGVCLNPSAFFEFSDSDGQRTRIETQARHFCAVQSFFGIIPNNILTLV
ncbi:hypothetical protein TNCV_4260931 [Trichonephila clavipes]|nr:hypothetical protein TNCV_4260931 [Trichonephila clavipes]